MLIPEEYRGQRVDRVLAQLFPEYSRSKLTAWLKAGSITLDGKCYNPDDKVFGRESISLTIAPEANSQTLEAEDIPLDIIYEDDTLLVLNKPAGLIVHPGAGNARHTLVNALLHHASVLRHLPRAGIIHRLDKETTGLLVVAKTLEAHTSLVRQMQAREIQREYLALVHGHIIAGGVITTGYGRDSRNRLKMAVCAHGKEAITHYTVNKQYQYATLLNVKLMTGRTHQIRVHMAHIHHAVIGDPLYHSRSGLRAGMDEQARHAIQQFKRQALHALKLTFTHPHSQALLSFTAPIPQDFQNLLHLLDSKI